MSDDGARFRCKECGREGPYEAMRKGLDPRVKARRVRIICADCVARLKLGLAAKRDGERPPLAR